jgi:predicted component of type VI protein secretion system
MATRVVVSLEGAIVQEVELSRPVMVVGRHPDCDIVLEHAAVSMRHALFRVVNRTVYVEDLASTNGTLVNGIVTSSQVLHHLDLVQVGLHKLHFFDDTMLAGGVTDLENTVFSDYERTMLAPSPSAESRSPEAARLARAQPAPEPAPTPPATPVEEPAPLRTGAADDGLSRTMAIPRPEGASLAAPDAAGAPAPALALRGTGRRNGAEVIALARANTMVGAGGADTALVVRRGRGYFLARLAGHGTMRINGEPVGPGTHPIAVGDRIEVGGAGYEVVEAGGEPSQGSGT